MLILLYVGRMDFREKRTTHIYGGDHVSFCAHVSKFSRLYISIYYHLFLKKIQDSL